MRLQVRYQITNADDTIRKVTKTFSTVNEDASNDQLKDFALAYTGLMDASGVEIYVIKVDKI